MSLLFVVTAVVVVEVAVVVAVAVIFVIFTHGRRNFPVSPLIISTAALEQQPEQQQQYIYITTYV